MPFCRRWFGKMSDLLKSLRPSSALTTGEKQKTLPAFKKYLHIKKYKKYKLNIVTFWPEWNAGLRFLLPDTWEWWSLGKYHVVIVIMTILIMVMTLRTISQDEDRSDNVDDNHAGWKGRIWWQRSYWRNSTRGLKTIFHWKAMVS